MNSGIAQTYCLFCVTGQEGKVAAWLVSHGYIPLTPQVVHWVVKEGVSRKKLRWLVPGYVFFDSAAEPKWDKIRRIPAVIRVLQYDDGVYAIRGADLSFVEWLKRYDGVIGVSQVIRVGTKIEFIGGPLSYLKGTILKVNKRRKQVLVSVGEDSGIMGSVWCPIEYVSLEKDEGIRQKVTEH